MIKEQNGKRTALKMSEELFPLPPSIPKQIRNELALAELINWSKRAGVDELIRSLDKNPSRLKSQGPEMQWAFEQLKQDRGLTMADISRVTASHEPSDRPEPLSRSVVVGKWLGSRHVNFFRDDGTICLDPDAGGISDDFSLGTWELKGHDLIQHWKSAAKPDVCHVLRLTQSEMRITSKGKIYTLKRVE